MNTNYYAVIMAGGVGSRFWPISTQKYPKQFHDMLGTGTSLMQKTYDRFESLIPPENILIATNKIYENLVREQLPKITKKQLLLEPVMRNTAPCILYSALKIYSENPDGIMIIAPSDHWIENEREFIDTVQGGFDFCEKNNALLTLGIQPTTPNTGYGYIQFETSENKIKKIKKFTEKPKLKTAKQFLKDGDYLWNAGIFIWSVKSIIAAYGTYLPDMLHLFEDGNTVWNTDFEDDFITHNYLKAASISIDFGIMEKATNAHVLPVCFDWNDLGTWSSLYKELPKDAHKNATIGGEVIYIDAANNIVKTQSGKRVVIRGLHDYIVVEKDDVLLICPKNKEQEIKDITSEVTSKFGDEFV
jgi:mannose-1-phosphate guanylyltransferase